MNAKFVGLGLGVIAVIVAAGATLAIQPDSRLGLCTQGDSSRHVTAAFSMARAADYRVHVPRMGKSPELETSDEAYLVAFSGTVRLPVVGAPPPVDADGNFAGASSITQEEDSGVVCVVVRGRPIFYVNVDTAGMSGG